MSNLVLKRKTGEAILMFVGKHELQMTIRQINSFGPQIRYFSSCPIKVLTQKQTISIDSDVPLIISHCDGYIEISGFLDDQNNDVSVRCLFKFERARQVKVAIDAPQCVEIVRDELVDTEVVA